jgi:hypothetical protein
MVKPLGFINLAGDDGVRRFHFSFIAVAVALMTGGCSRNNRPPLASVQGRVLFHGRALADATVTFIHPGAARLSSGVTDAAGKFTLSTYEPGDGAFVGENCVTVVRTIRPPAAAASGKPDDAEHYFGVLRDYKNTLDHPPPASLPSRYGDLKTTNLAATVEPGSNHPIVELVDGE